jgi:L-alanine-DL-glutamate epimerase-like enolase superfamily enzyme
VSRIERIEITRHRLPLDPPFSAAWDRKPRAGFPVTVIRVYDVEGRMGFGAGDPVRGLVDYLDLFIGEEAGDLDRHSAILSNIAFHDGRPWPLDTALWDLAAKTAGQPLWMMLGGSSDQVRVYASWGSHRSVTESVAAARIAVDQGFGAIKLRFGRPEGLGADLEVLEAVRQYVGADVDLIVDCNQGWRMPWDTDEPWDLATATDVAMRVGDLDVFWLEEPLHRGDHLGMARLREASPVRIAGGEMTRELHEFDLMLAAGALDVYQPDVVVTGGMTGLAGLARQVDDSGCVFSPHTWGSGVGLLANAHLTAGTVGTPYLEYPFDPPEWTADRRDFLLADPIVPVDGWMTLGHQPGLGRGLNEDALAASLADRSDY